MWHADPVVLAGLALAGGLFLLGVRRARARGGTVAEGRVRWFAAAYGVLLVALVSPLAGAAEERFAAHMVQHLLLTYVAAPMLALSAPVTLLLQAVSAETRRSRVLPVLRSLPVKVLTFPVLTWVAFAAVMYLSHFTGLYDAALRNPYVHGAEHVLYLAAAVLFWWPVVRRDPVPGSFPWPARLLYLLVQMPYQSMLGVAIYSSSTPLYAGYTALMTREEALADQQLAGVVMWVGGDMLMLVAIGAAVYGWFRAETRAEARVDARLDAARARP